MATKWSKAALGAVLMSLVSGPSLSATYSAPIPGLVGPLNPPTNGGKEATFDFGFEFSEIESVSIEIEAHVIAQQRGSCGSTPTCAPRTENLGLHVNMDREDSPIIGLIFSDALTYGSFEDPEGFGTASATFHNTLVGWDILLDGEGSLTLFWIRIAFIPEELHGRIVKEPSGEVFSARIIVEGAAVPEPSTALMIGLGLLGLASRRRRN